jgi:hypothetical protein
MARASIELVTALRTTALRIEAGAGYRWSHFGQCNCGHLAQTITALTPQALYAAAFDRAGDWGEQARDYCPTSGLPMDRILDQLFALGMEPEDVRHLERLSDDRVLRAFPGEQLHHVRRPDVVRYMRAWADLLERELLARGIHLTDAILDADLPLAAE